MSVRLPNAERAAAAADPVVQEEAMALFVLQTEYELEQFLLHLLSKLRKLQAAAQQQRLLLCCGGERSSSSS